MSDSSQDSGTLVITKKWRRKTLFVPTRKTKFEEFSCMDVFYDYIENLETRKQYINSFCRFMEFLELDNPETMLEKQDKEIEELLKQWLRHLKKQFVSGERKAGSFPSEMCGIKHFLTYHDRNFNWKRINKMQPRLGLVETRPYSREMIQQLLEANTKIRNRFLITFLASTGCRIGALENMRCEQLQKIENCYAVTIYPNFKEQYISFLTPESSRLYERYIEKRKTDGEDISPKSAVFNQDYVKRERPLTVESCRKIVERSASKANIRGLKSGRRFEIQPNHGFRKFFATTTKRISSISYSVSERLLGHQSYLDGTYFKPTVEELFEEYKKAIPNLTIDQTEAKQYEIEKLEAEKQEMLKQQFKAQRLEDMLPSIQKQLAEQGIRLELNF